MEREETGREKAASWGEAGVVMVYLGISLYRHVLLLLLLLLVTLLLVLILVLKIGNKGLRIF